MLNTRIRALAAKDLQLHWRAIVTSQLAIVGVILLGKAMRPHGRPAELAVLVFTLNYLLAGYWGEWLVSREKGKGTVAWLRSLPVTDFDLVTSKLVAQAFCIVSLWALSSGLSLWDFFFPRLMATWAVVLLAILTFGALSLTCRWRFRQKAGQVLPFALAAGLIVPFVLARRWGADVPRQLEALWTHGGGKAAVALALVVCYLAIWWGTLAWIRRSDTSRLVE